MNKNSINEVAKTYQRLVESAPPEPSVSSTNPGPNPGPLPGPGPVPGPGQVVSKKALWGNAALAAGSGIAGYYGTNYIADKMRGDNAVKNWKPDEFNRGVASFTNAITGTKVEGISKSLANEFKAMHETLGALSAEMTRNQPGRVGPQLQKQKDVESAMRAGGNTLDQNAPASYLPPT